MSEFKKLKKNEVPLTPEERKMVMDSKAVWRFNGKGATPAVWKSVDEKTGKTTYITNTHRAYNARPTLKGAISRYHNFIKSTASENIIDDIEKLAKKDNTDHYLNKIRKAGNNQNLVELHYVDKKGVLTKRMAEPYKIDSMGYVWAYDPSKEGIRRFKSSQIKRVKISNQKYAPRWPIEVGIYKPQEKRMKPIEEKKASEILDGMWKMADLNPDVKLYPHQQRAVDKKGDGIIMAHSVGSGKTLSAIARFEKLRKDGKANKALVVVPSSLRDNFAIHGVEKFTDSKANIVGNKGEIAKGSAFEVDPNADYNVISYEMFKKDPEKYIKESGADTLISDENHRTKNEGTTVTESFRGYRPHFKNYIGLTGSVVSNSIADVQPLVDIASNKNHGLGANKDEFLKTFVRRSRDAKYKDLPVKRRPIEEFKYKNNLKSELKKYIDYVDYDDVKHIAKMPEKKIIPEPVPISDEQAKLYRKLLKANPEMVKLVTSKRLETLKDEEAAKAFNKIIEARKLMNSVGSVVPGISLTDSANRTPKTKKMLDDLTKHLNDTPDGQAILLSHLVNGGTDVLEAGLQDRHIPYGKFIGKGNQGVTEEARQQAINDYNARKKKVMIISSAGGEGLSLNDTTWEGVLDPHYNPEKMNQMEARGIRSGGLSHRKPEDREVQVHRYMATMPKTLGLFSSKYRTPDETIYEIANNKEHQNKLLLDLLKQNNKSTKQQ